MFARMDEILSGRSATRSESQAALPAQTRLTFAALETMKDETRLFSDNNCVICYDDMTMPVVIPCRHVFCFECIVTWASTSHRCPSCRQDIEFGRARSRWMKYVPPVSEVGASKDESVVDSSDVASSSAEAPIEESSSSSSRAMVSSAKMDWIVSFCESHPTESVIVYSNGASSFIAS
jgi:hypothetical protein